MLKKNSLKENETKKMRKSEQGITLVALVITVIIIIILSTVTISFVFGENGLITRAEQAKDFYANDTKYTEGSMTNVESYLEGILAGTGTSGEGEETPEPEVPLSITNITTSSISVTVTATPGTAEIVSYTYSITGKSPVTTTDASYTFTGLTANTTYDIQITVTDKAGKTSQGSIQATTQELPKVSDAINNNTSYTETTQIADDLGNPVWIPGGFHLASDSGTKVEEGIVIEDNTANKNQFVWIPAGEYNVTQTIEEITETNVQDGKLINELTRRQWATTANTVQVPTPITGDEVANGYDGEVYYGEGATQDKDGSPITPVETNIGAFITNATTKGGFYIGRYEQGTDNVCKAGVAPYVNITRDVAKTLAESMYSGNTSIKATTELISSYAWDTALNFICQTNTDGYELATTTDETKANIGTDNKTQTGKYEADKYSNIHDFLGNVREWTTEYSSHSLSFYTDSCVGRGGIYNDSSGYAAYRKYYLDLATFSNDYLGFRVQLYVK